MPTPTVDYFLGDATGTSYGSVAVGVMDFRIEEVSNGESFERLLESAVDIPDEGAPMSWLGTRLYDSITRIEPSVGGEARPHGSLAYTYTVDGFVRSLVSTANPEETGEFVGEPGPFIVVTNSIVKLELGPLEVPGGLWDIEISLHFEIPPVPESRGLAMLL